MTYVCTWKGKIMIKNYENDGNYYKMMILSIISNVMYTHNGVCIYTQTTMFTLL